jgi:glutathione S-transferase
VIPTIDKSDQPILYLFAISHYCEKARWALDIFGIPYQARFVAPGTNRPIAKKLGGRDGSVPFLHTRGELVLGSSAIIDWGDAHRKAGRPSLAGNDTEAVRTLEKRLDKVTGVHVRRFYYSDALFTIPGAVRSVFARDLPIFNRIMVTLSWPMFLPVMKKALDLGPGQGVQSRDRLLDELDWLDGLLDDGRHYLAGDILTRADITAASLLAPIVTPAKHPVYATLPLPVSLAATIKDWQDRPILRWVKKVYDQHR